jgi:hypothetical protein
VKIVCDIDGTLIYSEILNGEYFVTGINKALVEKLNSLYKENEIIIYTGRHWNHLNRTQMQLHSIGLCYDTLVMGKPVADFYIDDKAVRPDEFISL